jgi:hypothetical protein
LVEEQRIEEHGGLMVEEQQGIAGDRAGKDLVNAGDFSVEDLGQSGAYVLDREDGDFWDFENDAAAGEFGQSGGGAAIADVNQFGERFLLSRRQFHDKPPFNTVETVLSTCSRSKGLVMKPLAPVAWASARVEV